VGATAATVNVRAVAGLLPDEVFCIYALDLNAASAYRVNGGAELESNCGVMINSNDPSYAYDGDGGACTKASIIAVTGGADYAGCSDPAKQTVPETGMPAVPDPLAHLPEPSAVGLPNGNSTGPASNRTYYPGIYNKEVKLNGGEVATFMPGLYYLQKGMTINGGATAQGTDVTFFFENPRGNNNLTISSTSIVTLAAPTSGTYMGILFFGDRDAPYKNPSHMIGRGSSGAGYTGALYFPNEHVDFAGSPAASVGWTIVVARTVNFSGGSYSSVFNPPPPDENPLLVPVMVE